MSYVRSNRLVTTSLCRLINYHNAVKLVIKPHCRKLYSGYAKPAVHLDNDSVTSTDQLISYKSDTFQKRHIGCNDDQRQQMLAKVGYQTMEDLMSAAIPETIRLNRQLRLSAPYTETELINRLRSIAKKNHYDWRSYIGMGYYNTITPQVIQRNIFENPGWITQYTPYQAEIAQGRLESLLNYQTMICDLTGLDIANASLLDEATAAAEAMIVCHRHHKNKRNKFLVSSHVNPQTISVLKSRANAFGIVVDLFDETRDSVADQFKGYSGVLLQYPNTNGEVRDLTSIIVAAHTSGALVVTATDLLACTLIKSPGEYQVTLENGRQVGVDIAVGNSQRFGVPLNFGGPHAAFLSARAQYTRMLPGRVVGLTKDQDGLPALRLALQTREQHIRRDKATSNICTAQALLANMAAMYAVYHGPSGLKQIAESVHSKTQYFAKMVDSFSNGAATVQNELFFDTLKIRVQSQQRIRARADSLKINLRYYEDGQHVGVSFDETVTEKDLNDLLWVFDADGEKLSCTDHQNIAKSGLLSSSLQRKSTYLEHPVFNSHHSETSLLRYMKTLENKDISLTHSMIPLGSCTMKLNGTTEMLASSWREFTNIHPYVPYSQAKGYLQIISELEFDLCELTGLDQVSFQPNSGAQGEYAGLRTMKAYLDSIGHKQRDICLIPISAHGTNPASAHMAGLKVEVVRVLKDGTIDIAHLKELIEKFSDRLACLMITYPSTFGVFDEQIAEICQLVHNCGPAQVYLDGANMNAQCGLSRPGDYGADVTHLNLHKTFCIPHGGGGPGMGPIAVKSHLAPFLPSHPLADVAVSAGRSKGLRTFGPVSASQFGSPAILPISWSYIKLMGAHGLRQASEQAILNANYMASVLKPHYDLLYSNRNGLVAHEFIVDCREFGKTAGVQAMDLAKRLQDFGFHAPTVSWPVSNTLMVEPTESENKQEMDKFCDAMITIRDEIRSIESGKWDHTNNPLKQAPHTQRMVCSDEWTMPYTRQQAAFPAAFVKPETKIWPTVRRTDDSFGDQNLFCTCPPLESYSN